MNSAVEGFYKKTIKERVEIIAKECSLNEEEKKLLEKGTGVDFELADKMIENVISVFGLPFGIATYFTINGKDIFIPMVTEEPSVVAAASNAAKLARKKGGFTAKATESLMIGQVQLVDVEDFSVAEQKILSAKNELIEDAKKVDPILVKFGGGLKDIEVRVIEGNLKKYLVVHLIVDAKDAMGANAVNSIAEALSEKLEKLSGGKSRLKIISNLAVKRTVKATAVWSKEDLGEELIEGILEAADLAENDEFRACTHNKGIMNGISAVVIATGNDSRAVEAGAHTFASHNGKYKSLTKYWKDNEGNLVGEIELPMAIGIVGGATKTLPMAQVSLKILDIKHAKDLAEVIASVGLAQNFAALRAIVKEGINAGHMRLHKRKF